MNKPTNINITNEYKTFIKDIKSKITQSQIKIASTVNSSLLIFYWELGEMISLKQKETKWGSKFIEEMANDLKKEFPSLKGFSRTNLFYIKKFYEFYSTNLVQLNGGLNKNDDKNQIVHHGGGLIESIVFQKIGNSQGIRIPKPLIQQAHLENVQIDLEVVENGLLLKPIKNQPRETWKENIEQVLLKK